MQIPDRSESSHCSPPRAAAGRHLLASLIATQAFLLSACGTPQIDIHASPDETYRLEETVLPDLRVEQSLVPQQTEIFVDGRRAGHGLVSSTIPYYGAVSVRATASGANSAGSRLGEKRALLSVEPPLSRWLFGIDFFYEMLTTSWAEPRHYKIELVLPELAASLAPGTAPTGTEALRERNRLMTLRR